MAFIRNRYSQNENYSREHSLALLSLGALGIVYGDIGTSPLYALRECFSSEHGLALLPENILGVLSLIFWTLMLIICVKYMWIVMKADNKGEGGILSLLALVMSHTKNQHRRKILFTLGLFGAALLFGDGMITPAISVLSAIEGLKLISPHFDLFVVPITIAIIILLFLSQRFGTGRIGYVFGPIILIWFVVIGALGINSILENPSVLKAVSPYYAIMFFVHHGDLAFFVLGSVFLVVTGGEALYADMGHFGRKPIRLAWFAVALPGLLLNYFGQGALLLTNPAAVENPFYFLAPKWSQIPLIVLSTMATVIASQALISGVFSITKQAVQLGLAPRIPVIHTSSREIGQIYIPFMNWALMIGVVWLVMTFKTSSQLASAYGIAVTGTMVITTLLAYEVSRVLWSWSRLLGIAVFGFFLIIDMAFFITNSLKVLHGGWVPLVIGAVIYLLMSTWQKGRQILAQSLRSRSLPWEEFFPMIQKDPPHRVPGYAIYMSSETWGVPVPLLHSLKHNKVLHSKVAVLTIRTKEVPFTAKGSKVKIENLSKDFFLIIAEYGFMEAPKIKHILEACREQGNPFPIQETTFVLGRETILPTGNHPLPIWREKLFAWMARNAQRPTSFFKIPPNQVIEVGIQVEI